MRDHWVEELPETIRTLYPRWDLLGRPRAARRPSTSRDPPRDEPRGGPARRRRPARSSSPCTTSRSSTSRACSRDPGDRSTGRACGPRSGAPTRSSRRRAARPRTCSRGRPWTRGSSTSSPLASSLPTGALDAEEVLARLKISGPYVLFVGHARAAEEPRAARARLPPRRRERLPPRAGAGRPARMASRVADARARAQGPGEIVMTGPLSDDGARRASTAAADVFAYPSLYEGFGLPGRRGDGPRRADGDLDHVVGARGRRRRRDRRRPALVREIAAGDRVDPVRRRPRGPPGVARHGRARSASAGTRPRASPSASTSTLGPWSGRHA